VIDDLRATEAMAGGRYEEIGLTTRDLPPVTDPLAAALARGARRIT
jgi:hypothetical protein